jgi:hypothetical protein
VSIAPASQAEFIVYPNPVQTLLYLKHPPGETITVFTNAGKKLQTIQLAAGSTNTSFDTRLLQPGYYFLQYRNTSTAITQRFIKY